MWILVLKVFTYLFHNVYQVRQYYFATLLARCRFSSLCSGTYRNSKETLERNNLFFVLEELFSGIWY